MTLKNILPAVLVTGAIVFLAITLLMDFPREVLGSSFPSAPALSVATTTKSQAITSSARVLATTTNITDPTNSYRRAYTSICNPNANPVFINLDADKAASLSAATYVIAAAAGYNACFELTSDVGEYNGSITASSTNQTSTTITVKEYVFQ